MARPSARTYHLRAQVGSEHARAARDPSRRDPGRIAELRRDLRASRAEDYIAELLQSRPPLTAEQLGRLGGLLLDAAPMSAGGGDAHAA